MGARARAITSLFAFQGRNNCDDDLTYDPRKQDDLQFLENLCRTIYELPTIRAAVECTPRIAELPVYATRRRNGNLGGYSSRGVEINMVSDSGDSMDGHFDVQLTTLPHEFRHGYQDITGCMKLLQHPRVKPQLEDHILFERIIEADATAFSLAVVYELCIFQDNQEPLNRAWEVHRGSVEAYWKEVGRSDNNHWNGQAAQAAFQAYFENDNRQRLKRYDLRLCEEFMRAATSEESEQHYVDAPKNARQGLFMDYLRPISRMPFVARSGKLVEREAYHPERCGNIMRNLSYEAQSRIKQANRMLFTADV